MQLNRDARAQKTIFGIATSLLMVMTTTSCASLNAYQEYAAHGYLTPGPTGEPELIGIYPSERECNAAAQAWASRQVVGNPIFSECLPVDRN